MTEKAIKTDEEWRRILGRYRYVIMRRRGTEPAFSGEYHDFEEKGAYLCACCGAELFRSEAKFDSGTGWPSFFRSVDETRLHIAPDVRQGELRMEVICARCDGHLGFVYDDGPPPTGKRYCLNSASLDFVPDET